MNPLRAATPGDAFWTLDPFAVIGPDHSWHVDLQSSIGGRYGLVTPLRRRLEPRPGRPPFVQVAVVGNQGTGKTTQVQAAMADLTKAGIRPVWVNALESFDQADLTFSDFVLVLARAVLDELKTAGAEVPEETRKLLYDWFAVEVVSEEHRDVISGSVETEAGAGASIPFLASFLAKITASLKTDNEYRREIRRRSERDPAELLRRANQLLDAAGSSLSVQSEMRQEIAVIFDNLEKLPDRQPVDVAILRRAEDLRSLRCHLVLFFHPADQYAPLSVQVGQVFDLVTLPALPLRAQTDNRDHVSESALAAIRALLDRRVDVDRVFADPNACVRELARLSGGRIRDLFHLARLACELSDPDPVGVQQIVSAGRRLRGERTPAIASAQWPRLAEIHRDKQVANESADQNLFLHSLVLNYDGDPWWDVHPLVRLDNRFELAWNDLTRITLPTS